MPVRKIEKVDWRDYFARLTRHLPASKVDILVSGLDLGVQVEVQKLPLEGISYDLREKTIEVGMRGLTHRIHAPTEVHVEAQEGGIRALRIVDGDGRQQVLELTALLVLPRESSVPPRPN